MFSCKAVHAWLSGIRIQGSEDSCKLLLYDISHQKHWPHRQK